MSDIEWQVAPADHEIANYDEPKIRYRSYVERIVKPHGPTSVRKKTFFTIATNVLCADVNSSNEKLDPRERDIYLPLEIALTKWSLAKSGPPKKEHPAMVWMINPGPPIRTCINVSLTHKVDYHKIEFDPDDMSPNGHFETNLDKVMKEINMFLNPDRTVYSLSLRHVRQDLGCIKWLNKATGFKARPVLVLSLEDLYVVLIRHLCPDVSDAIGQGIARHNLESYDGYNPHYQCDYHKLIIKKDGNGSKYCAKALVQGCTDILISEVMKLALINQQPASTVKKATENSNQAEEQASSSRSNE